MKAHLLTNELVDHAVLCCIGILKLIHQNVTVNLLIACTQLRPFLQQLDSPSHQVIIVKLAAGSHMAQSHSKVWPECRDDAAQCVLCTS